MAEAGMHAIQAVLPLNVDRPLRGEVDDILCRYPARLAEAGGRQVIGDELSEVGQRFVYVA